MAEKEYIERTAANEALRECVRAYPDSFYNGIEVARSAIIKLPAADVRPVVRGTWIDEPIKGIRYHCSVCQGRFDYTWHFCPNCGADMREES